MLLYFLLQYEFPNPEWQNVSKDAKDLIRGMLETDPQKRLNIDDVIKNKWIAVSYHFVCFSRLPIPPKRIDSKHEATIYLD